MKYTYSVELSDDEIRYTIDLTYTVSDLGAVVTRNKNDLYLGAGGLEKLKNDSNFQYLSQLLQHHAMLAHEVSLLELSEKRTTDAPRVKYRIRKR